MEKHDSFIQMYTAILIDSFVQKMEDGHILPIVRGKIDDFDRVFMYSDRSFQIDISLATAVSLLKAGSSMCVFEHSIISSCQSRCGHGMTFDVDHERCELSKNIDCKYGERPNWKPPEGCQQFLMHLLG